MSAPRSGRGRRRPALPWPTVCGGLALCGAALIGGCGNKGDGAGPTPRKAEETAAKYSQSATQQQGAKPPAGYVPPGYATQGRR